MGSVGDVGKRSAPQVQAQPKEKPQEKPEAAEKPKEKPEAAEKPQEKPDVEAVKDTPEVEAAKEKPEAQAPSTKPEADPTETAYYKDLFQPAEKVENLANGSPPLTTLSSCVMSFQPVAKTAFTSPSASGMISTAHVLPAGTPGACTATEPFGCRATVHPSGG